uniref:Peptidase M13 C-terminal domain-containing protein n=1 Tax=Strigamia maritima TaxID=126957 RepID=T1JP74_STRMM
MVLWRRRGTEIFLIVIFMLLLPAITLGMNIDRKANPCEDFYQFACGGYIKRTTIPEDKIIVDTIDKVQSELTGSLKAIIEEPKSLTDGEAIKKLKDMYNACLDTETIKKLGLRPLQELIRGFGGWPVVDGSNWISEGFDWQKLLYKFKEKGVFYDFLLSIGVAPDPKDTSQNIIHLDQPPFAIGNQIIQQREWGRPQLAIWKQPTAQERVDNQSMKVYFNVMLKMAINLGANKTSAQKELQSVVEFERQLAQITKKKHHNSLKKGFLVTDILGLIQMAPHIDWLDYFNEVVSHRIRRHERILVMAPDYIKQLSKLLAKTNERTLANYLIWQAVQSVAHHLGPPFQDLIFSLHSHNTGQVKRQSRWLECLAYANRNMGLSMGALYVRKYFNSQAKEKVRNSAMVYHVAYPDQLLENSKLDRFYRKLQVNRNQHLQNALKANKFRRQFQLGRLRKSTYKDSWVYHGEVANVNALYGVLENSIQIHAGMLHGWFFEANRPQYLNFGSIGAVIGHEITHGFDDQGRQFDETGNLKGWWDPVTDQKFSEKASCFVKQYENYTVQELNQTLDGKNTLGENIADNGGVKIAYKAYLKWANKNNKELKLPGLSFTPRQLFWLSYANNWCGKMRPEVLHVYVTRGRHSPNKIRVNGPLANLKEFAKDFACATDSVMNPKKKCELW